MNPDDPKADRPQDPRRRDTGDDADGNAPPAGELSDDELEFLDEDCLQLGEDSAAGAAADELPGAGADTGAEQGAELGADTGAEPRAETDVPLVGAAGSVNAGDAADDDAQSDSDSDSTPPTDGAGARDGAGQGPGGPGGPAQQPLVPSPAPDPGAAPLIAPISLGSVVPLQVCKNQAEGSAMQAVAQSAAIAVQDATDFMRSIEQVTAAAVATFTAMYVASGGTDTQALTSAQTVITTLPPAAAATYTTIGADAAAVMSSFGLGSSG